MNTRRIFAVLTLIYIALPCLYTVRAQSTPVKVSWSVWGSDQELVSHQHVADVFMKTHTNIQIEIRHMPWDGYHDQIKLWVASGDPEKIPDVMWLGEDFERYHDAGVLENLTPWMKKTGYDVTDYWPNLIERASYSDGVYGLQRDLDLRILYYNKTIFDAAGVAYPNETWTWEDWLAAAKKLTVIGNDGQVVRYGIGMEMEKFDMFLLQNGGALLDNIKNPSQCLLDTEKSRVAVNFWATLFSSRSAMRVEDLKRTGGDAQAFLSGKVAMIIQNGSRAPEFNQAGLNYDVAPIPIPKGGKRVNNNDGARFVMSARSLHKEETWTFLSWLQSKDGGQSLYTATGEIFPALKSVASSDTFLKLAQKPANRAAFNLEAAGGTYLVLGDFPDWGDLNDNTVTPTLLKVWNGEGKPDDIVGSLCDRVNDFLKQNGYPKP